MRDSGPTNLQVGLPGGAKERRDLVPARCVPRGQRPWTRGDRHSESARRRLGSVGPSSRSGARRTSSHRAGGAIYLVSQRLVPRAPRRPAGTYPLPIALASTGSSGRYPRSSGTLGSKPRCRRIFAVLLFDLENAHGALGVAAVATACARQTSTAQGTSASPTIRCPTLLIW